MPWSFSEDRKLLIGITDGINRTENAIKQRTRMLVKTTTLEKLFEEELFIIKNYTQLSTKKIGEKLGISTTAVSRRILAMKREGFIKEDKPNVHSGVESKIEITPMPKQMKVITPKGSLSRKEVQGDRLEKGKVYNILTLQRGDRRSSLSKESKMQLLECYPNHYLFTDEKGRKHSLSKVNLAIGEWKYEEVTK